MQALVQYDWGPYKKDKLRQRDRAQRDTKFLMLLSVVVVVIVTVSDGSNRGGNSNGIPETIGVRAGVWESTCEVSRSVFTASQLPDLDKLYILSTCFCKIRCNDLIQLGKKKKTYNICTVFILSETY